MFINTRFNEGEKALNISFKEAILNPAAPHGGLYAPINLPKLDDEFFDWAKDKDYASVALEIIKKFNLDDEEIFKNALQTYKNFDNEPAHVKKYAENIYINELWHGPTRAFKDMALQPFGKLIEHYAKVDNKKFLIMAATSGDTGPATLEAFANKENIQVICMYPFGATSEVQKLQMVTQDAPNLKVIGIDGNFDDAQRALKNLLKDEKFKEFLKQKDISLSAANSVNFGRILFQIIYHIYACIKTTNNKIPSNVIVPTGNFGDALGAYYAKKMGANIKTISIASNANNILTDFINTGKYDLRNRELKKTISPAMDILISSNVERLLFDLFGGVETKILLDSLASEGHYELSKEQLAKIQKIFKADFVSDEECAKFIKLASQKGELIDPHTATAFKMIDENSINIITSTAEWVKFVPSMIKAIKNREIGDELKEMQDLAKEFDVSLTKNISSLFSKDQSNNLRSNLPELRNKILELI